MSPHSAKPFLRALLDTIKQNANKMVEDPEQYMSCMVGLVPAFPEITDVNIEMKLVYAELLKMRENVNVVERNGMYVSNLNRFELGKAYNKVIAHATEYTDTTLDGCYGKNCGKSHVYNTRHYMARRKNSKNIRGRICQNRAKINRPVIPMLKPAYPS